MSDAKTGTDLDAKPIRLRDALRKARIEAADRSGVVVDLRDAEIARLEILNEALDPLFGQIPDSIDLFDRGISQGDTPRLWIDVVAHVLMGRDKRLYRFVQDSRFGRIVLAESYEVPAMVDAITAYVARRMIERDYAMAAPPLALPPLLTSAGEPARLRRRGLWLFALGFIAGVAALFGLALLSTLRTL
jgi:hypothetical protein